MGLRKSVKPGATSRQRCPTKSMLIIWGLTNKNRVLGYVIQYVNADVELPKMVLVTIPEGPFPTSIYLGFLK